MSESDQHFKERIQRERLRRTRDGRVDLAVANLFASVFGGEWELRARYLRARQHINQYLWE